MNEVNMDSLLAQMRAMSSRIEGLKPEVQPLPEKDTGFANLLGQAVDQVNAAQQTSGALKKAFERGDENVDLVEVMVASQKADISFRTITEVRNKLITAYQEIMNMPV